ncbi:MAG: hypothetical protein HC888_01605 [Candidatus Competibacteraceae bacterium]|nr:hypothetical protein [Candidatus Competibacteraceae bacterium]
MAKFSDALDRSMDDIKRPPPLPIGNYIFRIVKMPEAPREIEGKTFEILKFPIAVVSAMDDVDPDELAEFGKVEGAPLSLDFIFNTDPSEERAYEMTLNRLKDFLARAGVEGATLKEQIARCANAQFMGEVSHRADPNDANNVYPEVRRTAAL